MSIYDETYQQFLTESNASLLAEREQELSRQYMEAMQGSDAGSMSLDDYDVAAVADAKLPQGVLSPRFLYNGRQVIGDYDAGSGERVLPPEDVPVNAPSWWENTRGYLMDQAKEAFGLVGASAYNTAATRDDIIRRTLDTTADLAAAFGVPEDKLVRGGQPMPETQSTALNLARDLTGYGVQFAGALGALRGTLGAASTGLGAATQTAAGAAATDFMMDPRTDSLIDAVANLFGMESALVDRINPATIYEQSPVMGRVALAGEGLAVGGLVDAAYRGIKRIAQNADEIERIGVERMRRSTHQLNQGIDPEGLRGMVEYFTGKALKGFDTLTPELRQEVSATGATAEQVEAAFRQAVEITDVAEQRGIAAYGERPLNVIDPGPQVKQAVNDIESRFHLELVEKPAGDRAGAVAKMQAGETLSEADVNALSPGMRRRYVDAKVEELREQSPFTHANLTDVPGVPQRPVERWDPPRGGSKAVQRLAKNNRAYSRVLEWARAGNVTEGLGWYNTFELRQAFVDELGEKAGNERFDRFIDLVAATSAGAKVPANISIASYYDILAERGFDVVKPPKGSGYGHKAQNLHHRSASEIIGGGPGLDVIANPKRYSFAENLKGNWRPATVDKHNVRAWGMASRDPDWLATKLEDPAGTPKPAWWTKRYGEWNPQTFSPQKFAKDNPRFNWEKYPPTWFKGAPAKSEYKQLEKLNERLAEDLGVTPAQAQAALWLGAGNVTGLGSPPAAFVQVFEEVLLRRAAERGQAPREVLSDFIHGKRPLAIGATAAGASMMQENEGEI